MPAFTPFLNLYKPGGGSTGAITPDEVVDIDRINQNMDALDDFAEGWGEPGERNHQFYGPAADRSSVTGMKRGDTYQETDGSFFTYRYSGSAWLLWHGQFTMTYAAGWSDDAAGLEVRIAHGTVSINGRVKATAGAGGDLITTLPVGARPPAQIVCAAQGNSTWLDIIIDTNGAISQFGRGTSARSDVRLGTVPSWVVAP